jgi:hypothetical protein
MQASDMVAAMANASVTMGWDAICALHVGDVNALLFNAYADGGPIGPVKDIKISTTISGQTVDLNLQIGPPLIAFGTGAQASTAAISMWVTSGTIKISGPDPAIELTLAANSVQISGTASLSEMNGLVLQYGSVTLDLTTGTFSVAMTGLDTSAEQAVGAAIGQYFAQNNTKYALGAVAFTANPAYPCLAPKSFSFGSQTDPNGDQCLLIFITTNGTPGQAGTIGLPSGALPIPDGYTAALFVSANALFNGVLAPQLTGALAATGLTGTVTVDEIAYRQTMQPAYTLSVAPSGGFRAGELTGTFPVYWYTREPVVIPLSLEAGPTATGVAGACSSDFTMLVCLEIMDQLYEEVADVSVAVSIAVQASVQAGGADGQEIAIAVQPGTLSVTATPDPNSQFQSLLEQIFADVVTTSEMLTQFSDALSTPLGRLFGFDFTPLSTFALTNLLFGDQVAMVLDEAYVPGDLLAIGTVAQCAAVTPAVTWVLPGGQVQLSAPVAVARGQQVSWAIDPMTGSIGQGTGMYTAPDPPGPASNQVVVVTATASSDGNQTGTGTAVIIVAAPLVVNPLKVTLSPGQSVQFFASQKADAQQEVNWSADVGEIGSDGSYTAPQTVTSPQTATVTASLPPPGSPSATATVYLQPSS